MLSSEKKNVVGVRIFFDAVNVLQNHDARPTFFFLPTTLFPIFKPCQNVWPTPLKNSPDNISWRRAFVFSELCKSHPHLARPQLCIVVVVVVVVVIVVVVVVAVVVCVCVRVCVWGGAPLRLLSTKSWFF